MVCVTSNARLSLDTAKNVCNVKDKLWVYQQNDSECKCVIFVSSYIAKTKLQLLRIYFG